MSLAESNSRLVKKLSDQGQESGDTGVDSDLVLLDQLNSLLDLKSIKDIRTLLKIILQRSKLFLDADLLCIYNTNNEKLILSKLAAIERNLAFPQSFSIEEIKTPYQPDFWSENDGFETILHQFGMNAGLKYIAAVPLGRGREFVGLFVAGGYTRVSKPVHLKKMAIVSNVIDNVLQKHIIVDTLQKRLAAQKTTSDYRNLVFENTKDGVLILDDRLCVMEINSAVEQMLGYSLKEVFHRPVVDVLIGADGLMDALEVAFAGIETRELGIVSLHRRNGQAFSAHIQSIPVMDDKGRLRKILILISDQSVNEQNRIRVQHLEQRAALGGLSAIFAHEVRNPINNISTAVQLLKVRIDPEDPNFEVLTRIQNDCSRLINLMESVLAFSRPIEPNLQPVDILDHLSKLLERWHPRFNRLNITFILQHPKQATFVVGDPRLMEQIFTNLISNAVDVMEKSGGSLAVKVTINKSVSCHPQVEVAISDSGPGIPDDIIEKIFDPFVSTKPKGTGLGLAITKHMVTAQRGTIHVNSFPGGSVFYVNLPLYLGDNH